MTNIGKFICLPVLMMLAVSNNALSQNIAFSYDACGNMESRYVVYTTEIISVELPQQKITIHPNPTKGEICVEISPLNSAEKNFIRLFDSAGRLLETKKISSERTYLKITGGSGSYLLNIHLGTNVSKWKIVKK